MNKKLTPRYIIIAIIIAWAIYALWPSISFQQMSEDKKETLREEGKLRAIESKIIKQGLDLKGGMYIVLEVDLPTLISGLAINKDKNLENTLSKVTERLNEPDADFFNLFTSISMENNLRLARYFHEYGASTDEIIGKLREESDDAINRVLEILQNRVDQFGVSEPTIQKQGSQRIIVELAGIQDSERARDLLQSTALLEFYLVNDAEITQDMLVRVDNILKGNKDIAELAENLADPEKPQEEIMKYVYHATHFISLRWRSSEQIITDRLKNSVERVQQYEKEENYFKQSQRRLQMTEKMIQDVSVVSDDDEMELSLVA